MAILLENGGGLAGRHPQQCSVKLKQLPRPGGGTCHLPLPGVYHPRFPFSPMAQHQPSWGARRRLPDAELEPARNCPEAVATAQPLAKC